MAIMKYNILLLDHNTRFSLWQVKMRVLLAQMDLNLFDKMSSSWTARKNTVGIERPYLNFIFICQIKFYRTAVALCLKVEQLCMTKSLTSKLHLKQRLYSYNIIEGMSLEDHLTVFEEVVSDLETMEVKYDEEDLRLILLCLLPYLDATFRYIILYSRDTLTLDEVYECYKLQNKNKKAAANQKGKQLENSVEADVAEDDYSDGELLVAFDDNSKPCEDWILDSSCTFHMCPNRDCFSTYEIVSKGAVLMGNNASCKVVGIGTVRIKMFDGVVRTLSDVRHVPDLKRNLISLNTLNSKGCKYTDEDGVPKVSESALVMMKGQRKSANL